ncbi:MAG: citrate/2-methylcitrate synthase [Clostridia bacterium]|nr:citrate/2-methylcitrate synthase [Clostridia bacterium]
MFDYADNIQLLIKVAAEKYKLDRQNYSRYSVKRGLRNPDGTGVLAGLTSIGEVRGYIIDDGEKVPVDGDLLYRGIRVNDLVHHCRAEGRLGFEEVIFLILFGVLPDRDMLEQFTTILSNLRPLPDHFTEDIILKSPSPDIMNKLARCILASYSFDPTPNDINLPNLMRQCIELIARMPTMTAYAYQAKNHYYEGQSLIIHSPMENLSAAENFLHMLRPTHKYTREEAEILDLMLMLHAEHGGGNNSAFACRVVSSSGTDTYSAIAAAVGSLKGPKHGGANAKVMAMMEDIKENVKNWDDLDEVEFYLEQIIEKKVGDKSGLVYGMGHAVYTLSDPRAILLKEKAKELAVQKGFAKEYALYEAVETLTPKVFAAVKGDSKVISANVDMYSGFVYKMLDIPPELYTPLFVMARIVGWSAHRIEEVISGGRIIRPAYKSVCPHFTYVPLDKR